MSTQLLSPHHRRQAHRPITARCTKEHLSATKWHYRMKYLHKFGTSLICPVFQWKGRINSDIFQQFIKSIIYLARFLVCLDFSFNGLFIYSLLFILFYLFLFIIYGHRKYEYICLEIDRAYFYCPSELDMRIPIKVFR